MSVSFFDVDAIVRRVLADLGMGNIASVSPKRELHNVTKSSVATQLTSTQKTEKNIESVSQLEKSTANAVTNVANTLSIADSLLTLAMLEGRLDGINEIVVSPKAIITPAVRDFLYKKEIKLTLVELSKELMTPAAVTDVSKINMAANGEKIAVWLALHYLKRKPEMLVNFLQKESTLSEESFDCIIKTVHAADDWLNDKPETLPGLVVVVTNYSAAALAIANRCPAIRAVQGTTPEQVTQDAAMIGANLLVMHADRLSAYRMREVARAFLANLVQTCPKVFAKALGYRSRYGQ